MISKVGNDVVCADGDQAWAFPWIHRAVAFLLVACHSHRQPPMPHQVLNLNVAIAKSDQLFGVRDFLFEKLPNHGFL